MTEILRYRDKVTKIEQRQERVYVSGSGDSAKFELVPRGWFITFESGHTINTGFGGQPEFNIGDDIRHTIEKV